MENLKKSRKIILLVLIMNGPFLIISYQILKLRKNLIFNFKSIMMKRKKKNLKNIFHMVKILMIKLPLTILNNWISIVIKLLTTNLHLKMIKLQKRSSEYWYLLLLIFKKYEAFKKSHIFIFNLARIKNLKLNHSFSFYLFQIFSIISILLTYNKKNLK